MAQTLAGAGALFAFGMGGSLHCAGMCGPLACLAGGASARALLTYHAARLASYAGVGALLFAAGAPLQRSLNSPWAGLLLALPLLLFALRPGEPPAWLGRLHGRLARVALPWSPWRRSLALGALTPLLPCGLFWAAASASALAPNAQTASAWMLAFAAGTLPLLALSQGGWSWLATWRQGLWGARLQRLSALLTGGVLLALSLSSLPL